MPHLFLSQSLFQTQSLSNFPRHIFLTFPQTPTNFDPQQGIMGNYGELWGRL